MSVLHLIRPAGRWAAGAACVEQPEPFFSEDIAEQAKAVAVCDTCPVSGPCLRSALAELLEGLPGAGEYGIRAGLRPEELTAGVRVLLREGLLGELITAGVRMPEIVVALAPVVPERTVYRWAARSGAA